MRANSLSHPLANQLAYELGPPSLKVLETGFSGRFFYFPYSAEQKPEDPFATNVGVKPAYGSPLYLLFTEMERVKRDRDMPVPNMLPDLETRTGRLAANIQLGLIKAIQKAHLSLIFEKGMSPFDTPDVIAQHIERKDEEVHADYQGRVDYFSAVLECLENGLLPDGLEPWVTRPAYTDEMYSSDPPVSEDVLIEGAKTGAEAQLAKNERGLQRLHFEWMSSMVIVEGLREGMEPIAIASDVTQSAV